MNNSQKKLNQVEDLGFSLHTALRKCCDSTPTSLLYNLITLDEFTDVWIEYLQLVLVEAAKSNQGVKAVVLKNAVENLDWGDAKRNALRCAFQLFSDDDWAGMAYYEENGQ